MTTHRPCWILFLWLACGVLIGDCAQNLLWVYIAMCLIAMLLRHWPIAVCSVGAILMVLHMHIPQAPFGEVTGIIQSDITIEHKFVKPYQSFICKHPQGLALVRYYGNEKLKYGDQIRFTGRWYRQIPKWQRYLDYKGIFWQVSIPAKNSFEIVATHRGHVILSWAIAVKHKIKNTVRRYVSESSAPTVIAILTGDRAEMSKELKDFFLYSGTTHILAISGMNMAIISAMFLFILNVCLCPRRLQFLIAIILLWFYTLLSGFSPPVVRACLMATIVLSAFLFDQGAEPLNSLGLAALFLLLINPANLMNIGFQLSFAAVAGIFWAYAPIVQWLKYCPTWLAKSLGVSIAASLATAPLSLWHFASFAPIGILANIIVVPLADIVVLLGLCLALTGSFCPILAPSIATCLDGVFHMMVWSAYLFSRIPGGYMTF